MKKRSVGRRPVLNLSEKQKQIIQPSWPSSVEVTGGGALAGLGGYGSDSSEDEAGEVASAHEPIWSMCVDSTSGYPYYWEQRTNTVSWEPPSGYLATSATDTATHTRVESLATLWGAGCVGPQGPVPCGPAPLTSPSPQVQSSEEEEERIELITSYYNSDSATDEESHEEAKARAIIRVYPRNASSKIDKSTCKSSSAELKGTKKDKKNIQPVTYGPELPPQTVPSPPRPSLNPSPPVPEDAPVVENLPVVENGIREEQNEKLLLKNVEKTKKLNSLTEENSNDNKTCSDIETDNLDETIMDELVETQAKLLRKLGELVPSDMEYLEIGPPPTPPPEEALDMDVDDLIAQIEKEQPVDRPDEPDAPADDGSHSRTADTLGSETRLFPSAPGSDVNIQPPTLDEQARIDEPHDGKILNKYRPDLGENGTDNAAFKRKRRIALDILPTRKRVEVDECARDDSPVRTGKGYGYSTKYARDLDTNGERTGFGFRPASDYWDPDAEASDKACADLGRGIISFQKGETLVSTELDKRSEEFGDEEKQKELLEAKLKFLTQCLPPVPPVQQLYIELQTLWGARGPGGLAAALTAWLGSAADALASLEARAAPPPWTCRFSSEAGCYVYRHEPTGRQQWQFPGDQPVGPTDMDICTTPPPAPPALPAPLTPPAPLISHSSAVFPEPLPPGTEFAPPPPSPPPPPPPPPPHELTGSDRLGAALDSFYSDLAALETPASIPAPSPTSPPPAPHISTSARQEPKKKSKSKSSSSTGLKNKAVSSMVAKWKKVQESFCED